MNRPFSAWRAGLPFYGPVLLGGLILLMLPPMAVKAVGGLVVLIGLGMLAFFRDFPRTIRAAENEAVAPADGKVVAIEDLDSTPHYDGPCRRVSIFLSVFNAHVNRAPLAGTVTAVNYAPGKFLDARDPDSSKVNESNAIRMDTAYGPVSIRQISGAVARRIICEVQPGGTLAQGEKFGMIRFGSRTELYLPPGTEVTVGKGEAVHAGLSIMARFPKP